MRPTTLFDWERVAPPLRWMARALALAMAILLGYFVIGYALGGYLTLDASQYVTYSLIGVGVLLAFFWIGIGEVAGGLALICGAAGLALLGRLGLAALIVAAPFALSGLLFIACGWSALRRRT